MLQARATSTAEAEKAYFERACDACSKTYYSENAYQNHLSSSKHRANEAGAGGQRRRQDDEATSVMSSTFSLGEPTSVAKEQFDSDAEDEFNQVIESLQKAKVSADQRPSPVRRPTNPKPVAHSADDEMDEDAQSTTPSTSVAEPTWTMKSCLFCNFESPTLPLSMQHMERFHGMFIPEKPYLADLEGLVKQLQRQISEFHECLTCGKTKSTVFGLQTHMRDKGHCKIPFSTEQDQLAIGDFYDFRSTYSDGEDDDMDDASDTEDDRGGARLGPRRKVKVVGEDGEEIDGDQDGEGWETDSSASSLDSADLTAVPAGHTHQYERLKDHPHHSSRDPRNHHQADGWHSRAHKPTHAAFYDDFELHLPSGRSVGHRSLNKYFRQNLTNYPTPEERAERLAIEGRPGSDDERGDSRKDRSIVLRNGQRFKRDVVPRGSAGLANVSDEKKKALRKSEHRGRDLEQFNTKKTDWSYGKRANNQKTYYYRYDGGG